jgi:hypothetical protein
VAQAHWAVLAGAAEHGAGRVLEWLSAPVHASTRFSPCGSWMNDAPARQGEAGGGALERYGDGSANLIGGSAGPHRSRGARWPAAGRVASPRWEGALGPALGDGVGVRRLGTRGAAENRGAHHGGSLPERQRRRWVDEWHAQPFLKVSVWAFWGERAVLARGRAASSTSSARARCSREGRARLAAGGVNHQLRCAADTDGAAQAVALFPCACPSDVAGGPLAMRRPLKPRQPTLQAATVSSAGGALSASSSARASRQQQACTGAAAAGSAAVGAASGRREQRGSSAACSNRRAQVTRRGEVAGVSLSRCRCRGAAQNFGGAAARQSRGAQRERLGEKCPPPLRVGPAVKEEEAAGWGRRHGLRLNGRLGSGLLAGPVKEKKDFGN